LLETVAAQEFSMVAPAPVRVSEVRDAIGRAYLDCLRHQRIVQILSTAIFGFGEEQTRIHEPLPRVVQFGKPHQLRAVVCADKLAAQRVSRKDLFHVLKLLSEVPEWLALPDG